MKIKFEVVVTRAEWKLVQDHMSSLMVQLHTHFPSLEASKKSELKTSMLRDLNRIPGMSVKCKNRFGGYMFAAGLKDDITVEFEMDSNNEAIAAMFDIAGVLVDVVGPFLNAIMLVSKGTALKELKTVYDMYTHQSKPTEYSVERSIAQFEEK